MVNCVSTKRLKSGAIAQQKHIADKIWNAAISSGRLLSLEFVQTTEECAMCFEEIGEKAVNKLTIEERANETSDHRGVKMHCDHIHCSACLQKWFLQEKKDKCPYCRTPSLARNTDALMKLRTAWNCHSFEVVRESVLERQRRLQCKIERQVALYEAEAVRVRNRLLAPSLEKILRHALKRLRWELELVRRDETF